MSAEPGGTDSPPQKRFLSRSKQQIKDLAFEQDSSNTKRCTDYAVRVVREFCEETGRDTRFETLPVKELDSLLEDFFGNVNKKNGTSYHRNGLSGIRYGISRHLKKHRGIDIVADPNCVASETAYRARQVELKKTGFGQVNHYPPIEEEDLAKLYKSFDVTDARSLRKKVQFDIMFYLCRRGRENMRELTKEHFVLGKTSSGLRCVRQVIDEQDKNHNSKDNPEEVATDGIMVEQPDQPLCPVASFEKYLKKLSPVSKCLWQRERSSIMASDTTWYTGVPVGKNSLAALMPSISRECELSKTYTNHSIRATSVTSLDEAGFRDRHIMKVSGHKSEQSIQTYSRRIRDSKRCEMSQALSKALLETPPKEPNATAPVPEQDSSTGHETPQPTTSSILEDCDPVPAKTSSETSNSSLLMLTDSQLEAMLADEDTEPCSMGQSIESQSINLHHSMQQWMPAFTPNISHSRVNININYNFPNSK